MWRSGEELGESGGEQEGKRLVHVSHTIPGVTQEVKVKHRNFLNKYKSYNKLKSYGEENYIR